MPSPLSPIDGKLTLVDVVKDSFRGCCREIDQEGAIQQPRRELIPNLSINVFTFVHDILWIHF